MDIGLFSKKIRRYFTCDLSHITLVTINGAVGAGKTYWSNRIANHDRYMNQSIVVTEPVNFWVQSEYWKVLFSRGWSVDKLNFERYVSYTWAVRLMAILRKVTATKKPVVIFLDAHPKWSIEVFARYYCVYDALRNSEEYLLLKQVLHLWESACSSHILLSRHLMDQKRLVNRRDRAYESWPMRVIKYLNQLFSSQNLFSVVHCPRLQNSSHDDVIMMQILSLIHTPDA